MTEETGPMGPEDLLRLVADAFQRSDLRPLFAAITDETVWKSAASVEGFFRFGGEYVGRPGITLVTSEISSNYVFSVLRPKEFVSKGEIVWGLFDAEADFIERREDGVIRKPLKFECAIRWRVRNGKVLEHQAFFDTISLLAQQEG